MFENSGHALRIEILKKFARCNLYCKHWSGVYFELASIVVLVWVLGRGSLVVKKNLYASTLLALVCFVGEARARPSEGDVVIAVVVDGRTRRSVVVPESVVSPLRANLNNQRKPCPLSWRPGKSFFLCASGLFCCFAVFFGIVCLNGKKNNPSARDFGYAAGFFAVASCLSFISAHCVGCCNSTL